MHLLVVGTHTIIAVSGILSIFEDQTVSIGDREPANSSEQFGSLSREHWTKDQLDLASHLKGAVIVDVSEEGHFDGGRIIE